MPDDSAGATTRAPIPDIPPGGYPSQFLQRIIYALELYRRETGRNGYDDVQVYGQGHDPTMPWLERAEANLRQTMAVLLEQPGGLGLVEGVVEEEVRAAAERAAERAVEKERHA